MLREYSLFAAFVKDFFRGPSIALIAWNMRNLGTRGPQTASKSSSVSVLDAVRGESATWPKGYGTGGRKSTEPIAAFRGQRLISHFRLARIDRSSPSPAGAESLRRISLKKRKLDNITTAGLRRTTAENGSWKSDYPQ